MTKQQKPHVRIKVTPKVVKDLKELTADQLSFKYSISTSTVGKLRKQHGISLRPQREWTKEMIADIKILTNQAVATKYGINTGSVNKKRHELNLPLIKKLSPHLSISPQMVDDLKSLTLVGFAKKYSTNVTTVGRMRKKHGINLRRQTIWTDEMVSEMSKRNEGEVAEMFGLTPSVVREERIKRKLPFVPKSNNKVKTIETMYDWPENKTELFHKTRNQDLADLLDIPYSKIVKMRSKLNIKSPRISKDFVVTDAILQKRKDRLSNQDSSTPHTNEVKSLLEAGLEPVIIAKQLQIPVVSVIQKAKALGLLQKKSKTEINPEKLQVSVSDLSVSPKLANTLKINYIDTVGDLIKVTKGDLRRMNNIGRQAIVDIDKALEKYDLSIGCGTNKS